VSEEFAQRTTFGDRVAAFLVGSCVGAVVDFGLYAFAEVESGAILCGVAIVFGLLAAFAWNQFWRMLAAFFDYL
jgi:hypothetical protein